MKKIAFVFLFIVFSIFTLNVMAANSCLPKIRKAVKEQLEKKSKKTPITYTKILIDQVTGAYGEVTYEYIVDVLNTDKCVAAYSVNARALPKIGFNKSECMVRRIREIKCY